MNRKRDENSEFADMSAAEALERYRKMADDSLSRAGDVAGFNALSVDDRIELLFHSIMHVTSIVARLAGHLSEGKPH